MSQMNLFGWIIEHGNPIEQSRFLVDLNNLSTQHINNSRELFSHDFKKISRADENIKKSYDIFQQFAEPRLSVTELPSREAVEAYRLAPVWGTKINLCNRHKGRRKKDKTQELF